MKSNQRTAAKICRFRFLAKGWTGLWGGGLHCSPHRLLSSPTCLVPSGSTAQTLPPINTLLNREESQRRKAGNAQRTPLGDGERRAEPGGRSAGGMPGFAGCISIMAIPMPANSVLDILRHIQVTGRSQPLLLPGVPADRAEGPPPTPRHPPQLLLE